MYNVHRIYRIYKIYDMTNIIYLYQVRLYV